MEFQHSVRSKVWRKKTLLGRGIRADPAHTCHMTHLTEMWGSDDSSGCNMLMRFDPNAKLIRWAACRMPFSECEKFKLKISNFHLTKLRSKFKVSEALSFQVSGAQRRQDDKKRFIGVLVDSNCHFKVNFKAATLRNWNFKVHSCHWKVFTEYSVNSIYYSVKVAGKFHGFVTFQQIRQNGIR